MWSVPGYLSDQWMSIRDRCCSVSVESKLTSFSLSLKPDSSECVLDPLKQINPKEDWELNIYEGSIFLALIYIWEP